MLYGLNEEDNIGLKIDERKRRRGDPTTDGMMDIGMGLSVTGSQVMVQNTEAVISDGDLAASSQSFPAKLVVQASRSQ